MALVMEEGYRLLTEGGQHIVHIKNLLAPLLFTKQASQSATLNLCVNLSLGRFIKDAEGVTTWGQPGDMNVNGLTRIVPETFISQ